MRLRSKTSACFSWASANAKLTTPFIIQAVVQVRQFNFAVTVTIRLIDDGINDDNDKDRDHIHSTFLASFFFLQGSLLRRDELP